MVILLPQLMKQKSICSFRNNGTKETGAQQEKQEVSGPELGWKDILGVAVNSSASGFTPRGLCSVLALKESREQKGRQNHGRANKGLGMEDAILDLSASQAGENSLWKEYTLVRVRLTDFDSIHGTSA